MCDSDLMMKFYAFMLFSAYFLFIYLFICLFWNPVLCYFFLFGIFYYGAT